jgi:hypothetical protein
MKYFNDFLTILSLVASKEGIILRSAFFQSVQIMMDDEQNGVDRDVKVYRGLLLSRFWVDARMINITQYATHGMRVATISASVILTLI